jgi:hypothetical protein
MEKLVKNEVMRFMDENKLITKHQHGFRNKKSCTTNLLEALDYATKVIYEKDSLDILFIDFEKAFDKVPHKRLLLKLEKYGISCKVLNWFEAFLKNRRQRFVLGDYMSDWNEILSGVPQGSVIGPILFIIYINDLLDTLSCVTKMYADDTKILARIRKDHIEQDTQTIQKDIDQVVQWTNIWLMRLNIGKCKIMHVGKQNHSYSYAINNYETNQPTPLDKTTLERDLGIMLSNNLKFHAQTGKAASNANKTLGILKNTSTSDIVKLEKIQHRATIIAHSMKGLNYSKRLDILNLTTLETRRTRGDHTKIQRYIKNRPNKLGSQTGRITSSRRAQELFRKGTN